jgi:hypothetical protein
MYSHTFPHLSERFFKGATWPPVEAVLHLVDGDHVFGLLYKEMYYRHLYASTKPTIEQRVDSWANYRELFTGGWEWAGGRWGGVGLGGVLLGGKRSQCCDVFFSVERAPAEPLPLAVLCLSLSSAPPCPHCPLPQSS